LEVDQTRGAQHLKHATAAVRQQAGTADHDRRVAELHRRAGFDHDGDIAGNQQAPPILQRSATGFSRADFVSEIVGRGSQVAVLATVADDSDDVSGRNRPERIGYRGVGDVIERIDQATIGVHARQFVDEHRAAVEIDPAKVLAEGNRSLPTQLHDFRAYRLAREDAERPADAIDRRDDRLR